MTIGFGTDVDVDGVVKAKQGTRAGEAVVLGEDGKVPAELVDVQGTDLSDYYTKEEVDAAVEASKVSVDAGAGMQVTEDDGTFTVAHANAVTMGSVGSATAIPALTYDAQGHVVSAEPVEVYPPTTPGTEGQYLRSAGEGGGPGCPRMPLRPRAPTILSPAVPCTRRSRARPIPMPS